MFGLLFLLVTIQVINIIQFLGLQILNLTTDISQGYSVNNKEILVSGYIGQNTFHLNMRQDSP